MEARSHFFRWIAIVLTLGVIVPTKVLGQVAIYGGLPFTPSSLTVTGELELPMVIKIVDFRNGQLIPTKDSRVPVQESFDPYTGKITAKLFTQAAGVTWQFSRAGMEFAADGSLYQIDKEGATISFTTDGVKMLGVTKKSESQVWRYDSVGETEEDGNRFMALHFFDPADRYSIGIVGIRYYVRIPNADGRLALPPNESLMKRIRDLRKGDLVDVYTSTDKNLIRIERSHLLPDEDMPDSRIFVRLTTTKLKNVEFPAVELRKFRQNRTYPIGRKDSNGTWVPDESLAKQLKTFTPGTLAEVDLQAEEPNVLRAGMEYFVTAVVPYKLPQVGKVVRVEKGKDGKQAIVEVTIDGDEKPASYYYKGLATLEPGQHIWFRPISVDGKDYLKFVWWKEG